MSQRGLAAVLDEINANGMPEATSRSTINRARNGELDDVNTPYGMVIQRKAVGTNKYGRQCLFYIVDARANLYFFCQRSDCFKSFLIFRLRQHPCSPNKPWNIILYNDEIVNGNVLRHENLRKVQAFYYSFREFGLRALSSEYLWFTLTAARSTDVTAISDGGVGRLARDVILELQAFGVQGFQFEGIIIWAKISTFVADESALKMCLDFKGMCAYIKT